MAALSEEVKTFIVQSLACYDTPTQVSEKVKELFDVDIARNHVGTYDPTKEAGKKLGKKYKDLFEATRKAFLNEAVEVPIANQVYRLRSLQRAHDYFVSKKNFVQAQSVLEQAAKEKGGVFTNKVLHAGDKENPIRMLVEQLGNSALPVIKDVEGEVLSKDA